MRARRIIAMAVLLAVVGQGQADMIVRFETTEGAFDVQLFDTAAPITCENFLAYVNAGDYATSFIHRSVPGFIVQGGGFTFTDAAGVADVPSRGSILNEPGISNTRGTIAMAKLGGDPDSATNQWFFNLADNSDNLDAQNGGFTVFGEVLGNGMDILDAIAALPVYNAGSPFDTLPLADYVDGPILQDNLVVVNSIDVISGMEVTPEPATLTLLALGALAMYRGRKRRQTR